MSTVDAGAWAKTSGGAVLLRRSAKGPRILRFGNPSGPFFVWRVGRTRSESPRPKS
ncbi:MAG: hypothetical protein WC943_17125 [Elusimicrobiota bacterium]|jgi:hypothetical protein